MGQIDLMIGNSQIETIRQFIQQEGLQEKLIDFVAKADGEDFKDWLGV